MANFIALVGRRLIVPKQLDGSASVSLDCPQGIQTKHGTLYSVNTSSVSFYNAIVKGKVAKMINGSMNEEFFVMVLPDGDIEVRYLSRHVDADTAHTYPTDLGMKMGWANDCSTQTLIDSILTRTSDPKEIVEAWCELSSGTNEYMVVNIGTQVKKLEGKDIEDLPNPEAYNGSTFIDV